MAEFDWTRAPRPPRFLSRPVYARAVAHLALGERATRDLCMALAPRFTGPARACLEIQARDEDSHAAIYDAYLAALGGPAGEPHTPLPGIETLLRGAITPDDPVRALLAFNVLLEGEALGLQAGFATWLPCPLFRQINRRIARAEARHVAFGALVLPDLLAERTPAERAALRADLRALWHRAAERVLDAFPVPGLGAAKLRRRWVASRWARRSRALAAVGLDGGDGP
ncbi:MAG: hypothetical protein KDE22_03270 [Rhodobacterales bacterium]|nr:hypothetical protein [Rhodobacterales bacterium]